MNDDAFNYTQAAAFLGIKPATLRIWVSQKKVPHFRISEKTVRFSRAALSEWLSKLEVSELVLRDEVGK